MLLLGPNTNFFAPKEPAIKLLDGLFDVEKRLKEVEDKVDGHDARIVALEENGGTGLREEIIMEMKQREDKKNNLVFRGIKESENFGDVAKEDDQEAVKEIVAKIGVELDVSRDILFMARPGRKGGYDRGGGARAQEGREYSRPLLVGFRSLDKREQILERAKRMKDVPGLKLDNSCLAFFPHDLEYAVSLLALLFCPLQQALVLLHLNLGQV